MGWLSILQRELLFPNKLLGAPPGGGPLPAKGLVPGGAPPGGLFYGVPGGAPPGGMPVGLCYCWPVGGACYWGAGLC